MDRKSSIKKIVLSSYLLIMIMWLLVFGIVCKNPLALLLLSKSFCTCSGFLRLIFWYPLCNTLSSSLYVRLGYFSFRYFRYFGCFKMAPKQTNSTQDLSLILWPYPCTVYAGFLPAPPALNHFKCLRTWRVRIPAY